ncbi:DUF3040 domain-containing protein [Calidifontibacter terrae]
MPLSEHEQRMLDQMEEALRAEDPKFASSMRAGLHPRRFRLIAAALGMLVGLGVTVVGVMNNLIWLGVLGFVMMVAVAAWAFNSQPKETATLGAVQGDGTVRPHQRTGRSRSGLNDSRTSGSFMQRLEERWERRRHDQW